MNSLYFPSDALQNLHAVHLRRLERGRMLCMAVTALLVLCCGIPDEFRVSSHYLLLAVVALMLSSTAFQCGYTLAHTKHTLRAH